MTLHPGSSAERTTDPRTRRLARFLVLGLLAALVGALIILLPFAHWTLELRMVEYIVPWLLRPSTGYFTLVLVLWIVVALPGVLSVLAGATPRRSTSRAEAKTGGESQPRSAPLEAEEIRLPTEPVDALGSAHRREMAEALGIPWRDVLIQDHAAWRSACEAAIAAEVTARRR